ncbi:MAG: hypothetical protein ACOYNI_11495, partial [Acidimicrobiia bacterium]
VSGCGCEFSAGVGESADARRQDLHGGELVMGENKRLFMLLGVGLVLVVALLGYQMMSSGDDGGTKRVVAVPVPASRSASSVPGGAAPTTAVRPAAPSAGSAASTTTPAVGAPSTTAAPSSGAASTPTTVARPSRNPFAANF